VLQGLPDVGHRREAAVGILGEAGLTICGNAVGASKAPGSSRSTALTIR